MALHPAPTLSGPNCPDTAPGPPSWGPSTAALGLGLKAAVPLQRPPHSFLVNMKLEAVDRRNPALIRVASVEDVEDHRIKVAPGLLGWGSGQAGWAGIL